MRVSRSCFLVVLSLILLGCFSVPHAPAHANTLATPQGRLPLLPRAAFIHLNGSPPGKFPFHTASAADGMIVVHFYQRDASFGKQLIGQVQSYLQHPIHDTLGFNLLHPVNIYIYNSRADFLKGAAVDNPQETGAYTLPRTSSIYMPVADPSDIDYYLPHELTHVVFHQNDDIGHLEDDLFNYFPRWLDEGLATADETDDVASDLTPTLNQAIRSKHTDDFLQNFVNDYPANSNVNDLCYAESRSFIKFLIATFGATRFHQFLRLLKTDSLALAGESVFGLDWHMLQSHWEVSLGLPPTMAQQGYLPSPVTLSPFHPGVLKATGNITIAAVTLPAWMSILIILALGFWVRLCMTIFQRRQQRKPTLFTGASPIRLDAYREIYPNGAPYGPYGSATEYAAPFSSGVAVATSAPVALRRRQPRWYDDALIIALVPVALIAGGIAFWRDPAHVAASGVVVAAFSAVPFAVVALGLLLSQPRRIVAQRVSAFALSGVLVLGLFAVGPMQTAQAQAYADRGAYTQAVAYLQHIHAPVTQQAQVYREWAQAAIAANDFPTAIAEWQTALTIDGAADVTPDCTHWLSTIVQWNTLLTKAHQFTNATQMLTAQRDFPHCAEQQPINVQLSTDHLAWGNFAYLSGDDVTAFIQFQIVSQQDVQTKDAAQANLALPEVVAHQQLMQALASDITGGDAAMTAKLQALMQRYPHTAAAREAVETPESVTGVLGDPARVAGEQIFFFAFATRAQAAAFGSSASTSDTSLFKFGGVCAPNGSFTVHVTPGYWYLPAWGDPSQDANYYVPFDAASAVFTVQPLTPAAIGVVG